MLKEFLERHENDIQISYYTLLNVWMISFSEHSYEYFKNPAIGLIRLITDVIQKLAREKLVRVAFMTYKNLSETCEETIE